MNNIMSNMLKRVADLSDTPTGAYNIRINGKSEGRASTKNIEIVSKVDVSGIDINIKPGTVGETVHIPVVIEGSGYSEMVYNDFYIGEGSDVIIIAGCGIHNDGLHLSQHDGVHTFHVGKNSRVSYVEKHYGEGGGSGERVLNPVTVVNLEHGSTLEMETVQIEGVDSTKRVTRGQIGEGATLIVKEKIMTSGSQLAKTEFEVNLDGVGSSADIVSRSVARGSSKQEFYLKLSGNNDCYGHSECDAIIMDSASVTAIPVVSANHSMASLVHEAAIGKIAGEQITKLMTLGLTPEQAEHEIISGFLK